MNTLAENTTAPLYLCSFSGGRTSAFMARFMQIYPKYAGKTVFVFANTGKEKPETLKFVDECDKHFGLNVVWLEAIVLPGILDYRIVDFASASRDGEPFAQMIRTHKRIPSRMMKDCTRDLKVRTIHKYMRDNYGTNYQTAMGIRFDEPKRIKRKNDWNQIYPLNDDIQVTQSFIRDWWSRQPFDLELADFEGNCDFCFLKSVRKRMTLAKLYPDMPNWWKDMETKYGNGYTFGQESIDTILEKAKKPFTLSEDGYKGSYQKSLFDPDLDKDVACFCSNTSNE